MTRYARTSALSHMVPAKPGYGDMSVGRVRPRVPAEGTGE